MSFEISLKKTKISFVGLDFKRQKYEKYQKGNQRVGLPFIFYSGTAGSHRHPLPAGSASADSRTNPCRGQGRL